MSVKCNFFNSTVDDDAGYAASDFAAYFERFIANGVFANADSRALRVEAVPDSMNIKISDGSVIISGYVGTVYGGGEALQVESSAQARTDIVVMRLDFGTDATGHQRAGSIYPLIVKGMPGGGVPGLMRNNEIWDMCLVQIAVPAGAATLNGATLTDTRGDRELCGFTAFTGQPPYQPPTDVPAAVWDYTVFPESMTPEQRAVVENTPDLYAMFKASRFRDKIGEVILSSYDITDSDYMPADSRFLAKAEYPELFGKIGVAYGQTSWRRFSATNFPGTMPPVFVASQNAYYTVSHASMRLYTYKSTDGIVWTQISDTNVQYSPKDLIYVPSKSLFVLAVSQNINPNPSSAWILTSSDGITWTTRTSWTRGNNTYGNAAVEWLAGANSFVAMNNERYVTSSDGITWTPSFGGPATPYAIKYISDYGLCVMVGRSTPDTVGFYYSTNGTTWDFAMSFTDSRAASYIEYMENYGAGFPAQIIYSPELKAAIFFLSVQVGSIAFYTTNGKSWTQLSNIGDCAWHPGLNKFIGTGSGLTYTSDDGITWTKLHNTTESVGSLWYNAKAGSVYTTSAYEYDPGNTFRLPSYTPTPLKAFIKVR